MEDHALNGLLLPSSRFALVRRRANHARRLLLIVLVTIVLSQIPIELLIAGDGSERLALLMSKGFLITVVILAAWRIRWAQLILLLVCTFSIVAMTPVLVLVAHFSRLLFAMCVFECAVKAGVIVSFIPDLIVSTRTLSAFTPERTN